MFSRLRRSILWVSRIKYCRGFGVQSPWAYRFVRYVINEHYPYYAYEDLCARFPHLSLRNRKLCELYLRIANHRQAAVAELYGQFPASVGAYLHAGCRKMAIQQGCSDAAQPFSLAIVAHSSETEREVARLICRASADSLLIVEGIHKDAEAKRSWTRMRQNEHVRQTFDLYYCGIIFFDKKKSRQSYKINF